MNIQESFQKFHVEHPEVYAELVTLARAAKKRGHAKYGIGALWEIMRWNFDLLGPNPKDFKLNNNYRSRYVRAISEREIDLTGFFEQRVLKAV
jgi:hypothetical protein